MDIKYIKFALVVQKGVLGGGDNKESYSITPLQKPP